MSIPGSNGPESAGEAPTCLLTMQGNLLPVSVVLMPAARCACMGVCTRVCARERVDEGVQNTERKCTLRLPRAAALTEVSASGLPRPAESSLWLPRPLAFPYCRFSCAHGAARRETLPFHGDLPSTSALFPVGVCAVAVGGGFRAGRGRCSHLAAELSTLALRVRDQRRCASEVELVSPLREWGLVSLAPQPAEFPLPDEARDLPGFWGACLVGKVSLMLEI